ncbi:MAG: F0F1 ATP synthase subunit delta [Bacteroidales bacterium]|nr:F0F1 ATP synthase subunit delta [Bacteroidales bacterium]
MNTGIISVRYAKALLAYAKNTGKEEVLYKEMRTLSESFEEFHTLREALENPILRTEKKEMLLITAAGINVSDQYKRFIQLVLKNKRETMLPLISLIYINLYRKDKNIYTAKLITATRVDKEIEERIARIIESKTKGTVEFQTKEKPEIIGGFVLFMSGYRADASVVSQLNRIRKQLIEDK